MGARCAGQKPEQTPHWSQAAAPLKVGFRAELGEQGPRGPLQGPQSLATRGEALAGVGPALR